MKLLEFKQTDEISENRKVSIREKEEQKNTKFIKNVIICARLHSVVVVVVVFCVSSDSFYDYWLNNKILCGIFQ